jgi:hypothetical protein
MMTVLAGHIVFVVGTCRFLLEHASRLWCAIVVECARGFHLLLADSLDAA